MISLAEQLDEALALVARLERANAQATCIERGRHRLAHYGGANAACGYRDCWCSVPVYVCADCGDCDYGDNAEAFEIKADCLKERATWSTEGETATTEPTSIEP